MDIKRFLKFLFRYKWIIFLVPIAAVAITYFLVKNLPKEYSSQVKISTGLLDQSKQITEQNTDFFKVSQQFSGIMEKLKMKKILNILSYNLIIHDLSDPGKSFRKYSEKVDSLSSADRAEVVKLFQEKLSEKSLLTLEDKKGKYNLLDIVGSMGYGEYDLGENIEVSHTDNSDFVDVAYVSEDPNLSAYVVNTLASEFIKTYSSEVDHNQNNSIEILDSDLKRKEAEMNSKNAILKDFKMKNGVLNLDKQSELVYAQITQAEDRKAQVIRDLQSTQSTINAITRKLNSREQEMGGDVIRDNGEIIKVNSQLELANRKYVDGGFKISDKKGLDSLVTIKNSLTAANSDKYIVDPTVSRQNLLQQKYILETTMAQLNGSVRAVDKELSEAKSKYYAMVPFDAGIQNYMRDADVATTEYTDALNRYNQTRTAKNIGLSLNIEEYGVPGIAEPSKKILYLAGSGLGSFFLCLCYIFLIFTVDRTITNSSELALATKSKTIGILNKIEGKERSIREIWNDKTENSNFEIYRDMLRALRFEINMQMDSDGSKILGITSLVANEGKTFIAHSLAYAFAMTGKKILLIADEVPVVKADEEKAMTTRQNFQTFIIKKEFYTEDLITIMNKNTARTSLLETQNLKSLKAGFDVLKEEFDLIIVDVNSLHDINIAKEWLLFTEKNIAIFEYGTSINDSDKELTNYIKDLPGFIGWVLNKVQMKESKFTTLNKV